MDNIETSKSAVSFEVAKAEMDAWLALKKVSNKKQETFKDAIETLIDAIQTGNVSITSDKKIIQELLFPVTSTDGTVILSKLEYKPRITSEAVQNKMKGVALTDGNSRINATVAALTDQVVTIIGKLDTEDLTIAQSVAAFFL